MTKKSENYISKKSLIRNTVRSFIGQGAPLIIGLFCIPPLITLLGVERFGFLTLIWVMIGYLSIFDLGLGKALTKVVGAELGADKRDNIPQIFWTGVWLMCFTGLMALVLVEISIPWLSSYLFRMSGELNKEARSALSIMAMSLPFVIVSTGMRGVIEAHQRFDMVNWIRVPLGIYTFLAPLLAARYISVGLPTIILVLAIGRVIFLCFTLWLCFRLIPELRQMSWIDREYSKPLLALGGWMTIANVIGPFLVYMDRFLIGHVISMAVVAYYTTPYEAVTKLWIIPAALVGVLFPAFSTLMVSDPIKAERTFRVAIDGIFLVMLPPIIIIIVLAPEMLTFWLGANFARHSIQVFQILAIGVFINSFGRIPATFLQGAGRPDIPAKLYLGELPIYILILWYFLNTWGIKGAAVAWVLRIVLDNVVLFIGTSRVTRSLNPIMWRGIYMTILSGFFLGGIIWIDSSTGRTALVIVAIMLASAAGYWVFSHITRTAYVSS